MLTPVDGIATFHDVRIAGGEATFEFLIPLPYLFAELSFSECDGCERSAI